MRLVLDTNVIVSGVLTPMGPPGQLLDVILAGEASLVLVPQIAVEYREVLLRPRFHLGVEQVHRLVDTLEDIAMHVAAAPWPIALEDRLMRCFSLLHERERRPWSPAISVISPQRIVQA